MNFNTRPRGFHAVFENSGDDDPCKALARQTKPQHIHRWRCLHGPKTRQVTHEGTATISTHRQRCANLTPSVVGTVTNASNHPVLFNQFLDSSAHQQPEIRIRPGLGSNELQELHLRKHRDEGILEAARSTSLFRDKFSSYWHYGEQKRHVRFGIPEQNLFRVTSLPRALRR